jgi:hypothetical protein
MYKAEAWFLDNIMTLHPYTTRYMLFSHSEPQNSKLELLEQQIERVSETSRDKSFKLALEAPYSKSTDKSITSHCYHMSHQEISTKSN